MKRFVHFLLWVLSLSLFLHSCHTQKLPLIATFGDVRGNWEPCGCDESSNYGGILRLSSALEKIRAKHESVLVLDLGNNVPSPSYERVIRTRFITEGIQLIRPDASLLNLNELHHLRVIQKTVEMNTEYRKPNYVLSNISDSAEELNSLVSSVIETPDVTVFGFVTPDGVRDLEPLSPPLLEKWERWISSRSPRKTVLLFSGTKEDLHEIQEEAIFDSILCANFQPVSDEEMRSDERLSPSLLEIRSGSLSTFMSPIGGQGVILSSLTRTRPEEIFWLDPSYEENSPGTVLMEKFEDESFVQFTLDVEEKLSKTSKSDFVGVETCKSCHPKEYNIWSTSKHATAFHTLKQKNRHQDMHCTQCHVVGADREGGFISENNTPHLAHVQCESCHGPGREHRNNPITKPVSDPFQRCTTCHNETHSPRFLEEVYWEKIRH